MKPADEPVTVVPATPAGGYALPAAPRDTTAALFLTDAGEAFCAAHLGRQKGQRVTLEQLRPAVIAGVLVEPEVMVCACCDATLDGRALPARIQPATRLKLVRPPKALPVVRVRR